MIAWVCLSQLECMAISSIHNWRAFPGRVTVVVLCVCVCVCVCVYVCVCLLLRLLLHTSLIHRKQDSIRLFLVLSRYDLSLMTLCLKELFRHLLITSAFLAS